VCHFKFTEQNASDYSEVHRSRHPIGAKEFEVVPGFMINLWTTATVLTEDDDKLQT
jgi:hypothetical protein